jgi:hypothetical protein
MTRHHHALIRWSLRGHVKKIHMWDIAVQIINVVRFLRVQFS